ncbi:hypothetical protein PQX77_013864 [Marasmius sp. AFHP31]|nr:hypothetical protein PQX77_013864 [Marasmius sp. AFHP31]
MPSQSQLTLWKILDPLPEPLVKPTADSPHVLVIGGGVIGLTTSWALLDRGFRVSIIAKEWASFGKEQRLTSQIAGALWEYPPAVCGQHTDKISLQHSKKWCMESCRIWNAISSDPELSRATGVRMKPIGESEFQREKMTEMASIGIVGFNHGEKDLIGERGIDPEHGGVDAYEIMAPIIDTDQAMG